MGRVFGISADGSYGFYWALQPSAGSTYSESFWSTQGNWTPIFTVANFASNEDKITVVLTSNQGTYTLPVLDLKPLESRTMNIRELLSAGTSLPPGVEFGGYRITGSSSSSRLMVKETLIDPVAALATPFYGGYQYIVAAFFYENPTDLDDGGTTCCVVGVSSIAEVDLGEQLSGEPDDYQSAGGPYGSEYGSSSGVTLSFTGGAGTLTGGSTAEEVYIWAEVYGITDSEGDEGPVATNNTDADVVCAIPVNFQQTSGTDNGGGTLKFTYSWGSNTGRLADLSSCTVGESVQYPGMENTYSPPSPPFPVLTFDSPTVVTLMATPGSLTDNHTTPGTFVTPFPIGTTAFIANQIYQYTCACANGGSPVQIFPSSGTIQILRSVLATTTASGTFTITKSGVSSSKMVP